MFLHSSLFFPPTKNASASRKAHAYMPWPVWRSPCCAATEERCFPAAKAPQSEAPEPTGWEDESPGACVQISEQHAADCKDQSLPSRRRKKDAGERAKEGSRPPYERGAGPAPWREGPGDLRARCSSSAPAPARCAASVTLGGGSHQTHDQILFSLFRLVL